MQPIPLVYVCGADHSGSTVLDLALSAHSQIQGLGEIAKYRRWIARGLRCTCGVPVGQCDYWRAVEARLTECRVAAGSRERLLPEGLSGLADKRSQTRAVALGLRGWKAREAYLHHSHLLLDAAHTVSGKPWLVDASKDFVRAWLLAGDQARFKLKLLHLVRDGRGYVSSLGKRRPLADHPTAAWKAGKPAWRTSMRWYTRNLGALWLRKSGRVSTGDYLRLRYEDFARSPAQELARVCEFLGLEPEASLGRIDVLHHGIGGNRMRFGDRSAIRLDESWRGELPARDRRTFELIGGRLNRRFGYAS